MTFTEFRGSEINSSVTVNLFSLRRPTSIVEIAMWPNSRLILGTGTQFGHKRWW